MWDRAAGREQRGVRAGGHHLVADLERQLALEDVERLVERVVVQGRSVPPGRDRDRDCTHGRGGLLAAEQHGAVERLGHLWLLFDGEEAHDAAGLGRRWSPPAGRVVAARSEDGSGRPGGRARSPALRRRSARPRGTRSAPRRRCPRRPPLPRGSSRRRGRRTPHRTPRRRWPRPARGRTWSLPWRCRAAGGRRRSAPRRSAPGRRCRSRGRRGPARSRSSCATGPPRRPRDPRAPRTSTPGRRSGTPCSARCARSRGRRRWSTA